MILSCFAVQLLILAISYGDMRFLGEEISLSRSFSSNRELDFDSGPAVSNAETPAGVLQEIGMKCGTKVKCRSL